MPMSPSNPRDQTDSRDQAVAQYEDMRSPLLSTRDHVEGEEDIYDNRELEGLGVPDHAAGDGDSVVIHSE